MAIEVFPTANDIGGSGTGRTASEQNMIQALTPGSPQNTILSGMTPGEGTGLAMAVDAGTALIEGYLVRLTAVESFTVTDDATKYVWLQLTGPDAYAVTAAAFVETADLTAPTSSALITEVVSSSGDIDSVDDSSRREGFGQACGSFTGDGGATQEIDLGATPRYVVARNTETAGDFHMSWSNIHPGDSVLETNPTQLATDLDTVDPNISWADAESDGGLRIIKDGFKAIGNMNVTSKVYLYIAWF